ncbi:MAG: flavin reductase [Treponema sp.]|nr:flavin reductase [Treponema sp.]MCL2271519.1 flavin reductase [Treponema sp.]
MHCIKKIKDDLFWVGANDRRLAMFEGVYSVAGGVSYNSYLLTDEKTVLFDTVDKAVQQRFLENVAFVLGERKLDYIVVQHMEPDHSAALKELLAKYPGVMIVCSEKTLSFIKQFFDLDFNSEKDVIIADEKTQLDTGKHTFNFIMAPMVHWPEVMVTYDTADKILFSADAFGTFGALNGALFADEVDIEKDYMDEYRRYYANIAGKYGDQVRSLLQKASAVPIEMICPLHGFVWRGNFSPIIEKYTLWSGYQPEEKGVMIAYASVYGNTENAAEILSCSLREKQIKTVMFDVSVTPASEIIAAAFRLSHLVFASTTYNAGIFISMEELINDLVAHNIQNRTVAVIENGSWAATSGNLIRRKLEQCKNITVLGQTLSLKSSLKKDQLPDIEAIAQAIAGDFPQAAASAAAVNAATTVKQEIDPNAMFKFSYGLFVLTAKDGEKDNGCIINTAIQVTASPLRVSIAVNKANYTHDMILKTKTFNLSILSESAPFRIFQQFGFSSGKNGDKFTGSENTDRAANGIRFIKEFANCMISAKVTDSYDYGSHTIFVADVTQSTVLSNERSVTYQYYFNHIKPKPQPSNEKKKGFVCKICGYVHEEDSLPDDFICPLCKHGAEDFEPL